MILGNRNHVRHITTSGLKVYIDLPYQYGGWSAETWELNPIDMGIFWELLQQDELEKQQKQADSI